MQRSGEASEAPEIVLPSRAIYEMNRTLEADQIEHADPAIKIDQVDAATEKYVLAVIQFFAALRILK